MIYYVVSLLIFYIGIAVCIIYCKTDTFVLLVFATPMILLVCLRGHTGTDTAAYYLAFEKLGQGIGYGGEPLFNWFADALWFIDPDPRFVVNGISFTTAALMLWAIARTRYGAWFGGLLIVPAMFFELTMNVMRFGLASSIFLLATHVSPRQKPVRYSVYAVLATGMHFSSALLFVLFIATTKRGNVILLLLFASLIMLGSFLMPDYIGQKAELYAKLTAPNASSGMLLLFVQTLMLAVMIVFRRDFDIPAIGWWICGALVIGLYAFTQITYAGIRFQLILHYLMAVLLLRRYAPVSGRMSNRLAIWLFAIGMVAFAGRVHNMLDEDGRGQSPFVPYRSIPSLET